MATNRESQGPAGSGRRARGFAAMDEAKQREIARKGGAASARSQMRDEQGQFGGRRDSAALDRAGSAGMGAGKTGSQARSGSPGLGTQGNPGQPGRASQGSLGNRRRTTQGNQSSTR